MRDYYTINEVAEIYNVSWKTVRRWIQRGTCKAIRLPGSNLIRIDITSLDGISKPRNSPW
jgi:excisionase family DNA binding protein